MALGCVRVQNQRRQIKFTHVDHYQQGAAVPLFVGGFSFCTLHGTNPTSASFHGDAKAIFNLMLTLWESRFSHTFRAKPEKLHRFPGETPSSALQNKPI